MDGFGDLVDRALGLFASAPVGGVDDTGADEGPASEGSRTSWDLAGEHAAVGADVEPLEDRVAAGEGGTDVCVGGDRGGASVGLEGGADLAGAEAEQFLAGPSVEADGVVVDHLEAAGLAVEDDDGLGGVFDEGAEARLTGGEFGGAIGDALFEGGIEAGGFPPPRLFGDVAGDRHQHRPVAERHRGQDDVDPHLRAVEAAGDPFEAVAAVVEGEAHHFGGFLGGQPAIGLPFRGDRDGGEVAEGGDVGGAGLVGDGFVRFDEDAGDRVVEGNRVGAVLEPEAEEGPEIGGVHRGRGGRSGNGRGPFGPFTDDGFRRFHALVKDDTPFASPFDEASPGPGGAVGRRSVRPAPGGVGASVAAAAVGGVPAGGAGRGPGGGAGGAAAFGAGVVGVRSRGSRARVA